MEYTIEQLKEFINHELSRIEGQYEEHDMTKEEVHEVENLLSAIGKSAGIENIWNMKG
jgi:hypothetical protein